MVALGVLATAAVAVGITWDGEGATSAYRHLYLLPALGAAVAAGPVAGAGVGLLGALLHALLVLPEIEGAGLTHAAVDGIVGLVAPPAAGALVGGLCARIRSSGRRLAAVLEVERSVAGGGAPEAGLHGAARHARRALGADRLALLLADGESLEAFGDCPGPVPGGSAAGRAHREGRAVETADTGSDPRFTRTAAPRPAPVRGLVLPLRAPGGEPMGLLVAEWDGGRPDRAVAAELALVLSLAIVNARLRVRQQRFAGELEERVRAATETLRDLDAAKSEFLSMVSHELRTPLTAIQGFSELLLERAVPPERARRFLGHVRAEAQRLARMVGELLDLSRIDAGRAPALRREAVDLGAVIEGNLDVFAASHPGHRFSAALDGAVWVHGDPDATDRILKNLLSNAVKYSPRGGPVRVSAGPAAAPPGQVLLAVEDEGIGIPADARERIFERHVRLAHPETVGVRGLGLGLALVRALAEGQGGVVSVSSAPGRGARFEVRLPRWPAV